MMQTEANPPLSASRGWRYSKKKSHHKVFPSGWYTAEELYTVQLQWRSEALLGPGRGNQTAGRSFHQFNRSIDPTQSSLV